MELRKNRMPKRSLSPMRLIVTLAPEAAVPLHRQLYEGLRAAILTRELKAGARLPSTREMAADLSVSRNTVMVAFEQLLAEGYVESRRGSGTYVAEALPDDQLRVRPSGAPAARMHARGRAIAPLAKRLMAINYLGSPGEVAPRAFRAGSPAVDEFPFGAWAKLLARRWRHPKLELLDYGDAAGYRPLREAAAEYLRESRAVRCTAEQVLIVSGAQQALALAMRVLTSPGEQAWIEDPGYTGARNAMLSAGLKLVPVPMDEEGILVSVGINRAQRARLAYVTPSHQHPLGVTMSLTRRLALLEWAARSDAWILEDDYDSEFRYALRPFPALQGLDQQSRVIYLGTFSKVLFPSLRLGYLVAPTDLIGAFVMVRARTETYSPLIEQAALTDFITEGHFARHIRRMRVLYAARQAALVKMADRELAGLLDVRPAAAGMHLIGWLSPDAPPDLHDHVIAQRAAARGVEAQPLSQYCLRPSSLPAAKRNGLLLGYAALDEKAIRKGIRQLKETFAFREGETQKASFKPN
jgi:GntR family transcriptional regulator/MocR family aminotransferase